MLNLNQFRSKEPGFYDYLNFATMLKSGVLMGKNGSYTSAFSFKPVDTHASDDMVRERYSSLFQRYFNTLDGEWMVQTDMNRRESNEYGLVGYFPDAITQKIDDERRSMFEIGGFQFENTHRIYITWRESNTAKAKIERSILGEDTRIDNSLLKFENHMAQFEKEFSEFGMKRLALREKTQENGSVLVFDEFLKSIREAVNFDNSPVLSSHEPFFLDANLVYEDLVIENDYIKYGDKYISVIAVDSFLVGESYPMMFQFLSHLPMAYRLHSRFIGIGEEDAISYVKKYQKRWSKKIRSLWQQFFPTSGGRFDYDAIEKSNEGDTALSQIRSNTAKYGFYTGVVVLTRDDLTELKEDISDMLKYLKESGIQPRLETMNIFEAWLGSFPSHGFYNLRRPLVNSINLSYMLPLSGYEKGLMKNPSPRLPANSSSLMLVANPDGSSRHFNIHEGEVFNAVIIGPTGTGKTYMLGLINAQFPRYENAKVIVFDKDYSSLALAYACGSHYDTNSSSGFSLAPFKNLDTPEDKIWAFEWVLDILKLQDIEITSEIKDEVKTGIDLVASSNVKTLTDFYNVINTHALREAIKPYLKGGALGNLLDSDRDTFDFTSWLTCFELNSLLKIGGERENQKYSLPVLLLMFRKIEEMVDGRPILVSIDEATFLVLNNPIFSKKVATWLDTWRKANVGVVLAAPNVAQFVKSDIFYEVLAGCKTLIFPPNPHANNTQREFYLKFGLNEVQTEIIATAIPKRDYYFKSPLGCGLFQLGSGPYHRAFIGSSDLEMTARIKELYQTHGKNEWTTHWLKERGARS